MQQVLQVSAKLSEGGAAGVARTLADELRSAGVRSPFAYGYGRRGGNSYLENRYDGIRLTPGLIAGINRTHHELLGKESGLRSRRLWSHFERAVNESDLVHMHIAHSYFADPAQLIDLLARARKPVVWTLHDQWIMTGRCAQPESCTLWKTGCLSCPDLNAYPPARIDHAARRWRERRAFLEYLQDAVRVQFVACAEWLAAEARTAGFRNVRTITNSVDREFWDASRAIENSTADSTRNIFVCRDLRDRKKVSVSTLNRIVDLRGQTLTVVGDNPPKDLRFHTHLPALADRASLATSMSEHDRLIFTSTVDYFPLTIAEGLTAGLNVLALDSPAAREFERHPQLSIAENEDELLTLASMSSVRQTGASVAEFDPQRMFREYAATYDDVLRWSA